MALSFQPNEIPQPDDLDGAGANGATATHPAYYSEVVIRTLDDPRRIDVVRGVGSPHPPQPFRDFLKQVQDVGRLVVTLFPADVARRREFFQQLHATADSGLRGTEASVEIGLDNLNEVKGNIEDTFPVIRGTLWRKNLTILVCALLVCLPAGGLILYRAEAEMWANATKALGTSAVNLAVAAFWIPLGVAVGLFLEFIFRVGDDIPYEQLRAINPGRWKPVQRALNTLIVAYAFAAILAVGAFQVGVANVLLNEFIDKRPMLSLAIGFVTGMAFPYVRDLVQQFRPARRDQPQ